jgi:hypothetical protein
LFEHLTQEQIHEGDQRQPGNKESASIGALFCAMGVSLICRARRAPGECLDAGNEFGKGERLDKLVIGTETEASHALCHGSCCRQHRDASGRLGLHQRRADLVTRNNRQIAVEDKNLVVVDARALETGVAVIGNVDRHCMQPQPLSNRVRKLTFVFDDQYAQVSIRGFNLPR